MRGVLFIGGTRYAWPLETKHRTKFRFLGRVSRNYVVGYSQDGCCRFSEGAEFFLVSSRRPRWLRFPVFLWTAFVLAVCLGLRGEVQLLLSQSPYEGLAALAARAMLRALGRKVAVITEIHGDWEESPVLYLNLGSAVSRRLCRWVTTTVSRFVLTRSDLVRTVSAFTASRLPTHPHQRVVTFPAFTDLELFSSRPQGQEESLSEAATQSVLFAGMLIPLKGVHVLIEAFQTVAQRFREATLFLAGAGDYKTELEQQAQRLGLEERVVFLGFLDQTILKEYMQCCSVFVLPSLSEGLGLVLLEAMACSKPVIGTRVGGIPELVQEKKTGWLVPPNDASALAGAIIEALSNPSLAEAMGRNGRKFVLERFSSRAYVENFQQMLEIAWETVA